MTLRAACDRLLKNRESVKWGWSGTKNEYGYYIDGKYVGPDYLNPKATP